MNMKVRYIAAAWIVAGAVAFCQSPIKGASGSSGVPSSSRGAGASGPDSNLQVKSTDQIFHDNPALAAKLTPLLPAEMTLHQACSGYKAIDQCISAIHLAKDANVPFADLKSQTTGKHSSGLEKAIAQLAPGIDAKGAVTKARKAAADDMKGITLFN
jgi:hypothetical protein